MQQHQPLTLPRAKSHLGRGPPSTTQVRFQSSKGSARGQPDLLSGCLRALRDGVTATRRQAALGKGKGPRPTGVSVGVLVVVVVVVVALH